MNALDPSLNDLNKSFFFGLHTQGLIVDFNQAVHNFPKNATRAMPLLFSNQRKKASSAIERSNNLASTKKRFTKSIFTKQLKALHTYPPAEQHHAHLHRKSQQLSNLHRQRAPPLTEREEKYC
jgi:peptide methionine sulfoxide reductase MsrA